MRHRCLAALLSALAVIGVPVMAAAPADREWRNPKDGSIFVHIPAGELPVGSDRYRFPQGFWLGQTEVTVGQYGKFAAETGYRTAAEKAGRSTTWRTPGFAQNKQHPVVWLAYQDALAYADWAGVDLPTEAEWVDAARAGTTTKFYWGNDQDDRYLWHRENSPAGTQAVARKLPNGWGLYDMVGNAWEYVKVATPDGQRCPEATGMLGASWTRCPRYKMRDGRMIDGIEYSLGPVRAKCPGPRTVPDDNPWDDDRGLRCIRRIPAANRR